jgi:hypothetical protein
VRKLPDAGYIDPNPRRHRPTYAFMTPASLITKPQIGRERPPGRLSSYQASGLDLSPLLRARNRLRGACQTC